MPYNDLILFWGVYWNHAQNHVQKTFLFTNFMLLQHLSSQSVSNILLNSCLNEAPPSEKHKML